MNETVTRQIVYDQVINKYGEQNLVVDIVVVADKIDQFTWGLYSDSLIYNLA